MAKRPKKADAQAASPNSAGPSNEDTARTMREVAALRIRLDEANGEYRARLKKAKGEGENTKQLIAALQDRKKDPDAVHLDLRNYARYRALLNMPLVQTEIFAIDTSMSAEASEEQRVWDVESAGFEAGKGGASRDDNRHPAGSGEHAAWAKGWIRGQGYIAKQMGKNAKKASSRRERETPLPLGDSPDAGGGAPTEAEVRAAKRGRGAKKPPTAKERRDAIKAADAMVGPSTVAH